MAFVPHRQLLQFRFEISHIRRHLHIGEDPLVPFNRNLDHGSSAVLPVRSDDGTTRSREGRREYPL